MGWNETFKKTIEFPAKFLANSGHAQQDIPGQHRLLNAGGMFAAWWAMDQVRHIVFGVKMKSEGEYVDVPIEDVPAPLHFLHKTIAWDPHSETPENQWKKLAYQLLPGVGAGIGATAGSIYAFQRNEREQQFKTLKGMKSLSLLDADFAAQFAQSTPLRLLAAFFGTFSAASGLTFMYGFFLNPAFATANGARIFSVKGGLSAGNMAPHKAAPAQIAALENYIKAGKSDAWAKQFVERVMEPLFGHELSSPEAQATAVKTLQTKAGQYLSSYKASTKSAAVKDKEFAQKAAADLVQAMHLDPKNAAVGNANPILYQFHKFLSSFGLGTQYKVGPLAAPSGHGWVLPAAGAAAAVGSAAALMTSPASAGEKPAPDGPASTGDIAPPIGGHDQHQHPDATGKTPEEYAQEALTMHQAQYGSNQPPDSLKWIGEGQLAVLPVNRMSCAVGLTSGLMVAGNMAKIATGYGLDGKAVEAAKIPTYLQWMNGIVKNYKGPNSLRPRDQWIKYAQWGVYSLGGLLGVKLGTEFAYRNVKEKNQDPHYLEDYLPRVSMHQGDSWSWLAAASAVFGSASGLFALPVPGLNYGVGLAGRATSMQDRNFMLPGLNKAISGATTTSFLRLREGMNYLCQYAVGNPAQDPAQIEYLAYTLLGPVFKDKLTVEHIQQFTDAVHKVRDKYWQEGGIPKEKRKEALKTMNEVFTGAGLEVLLIDMGLNPGTIEFEKLNGLTGTIGNLGISDTIKAEEKSYQHALQERLPKYISEGLISETQARWVTEGIEAMRKHQPLPAPLAGKDTVATEAPEMPIPEPADKKFAHGKMKRMQPFDDLLRKSHEMGDWRHKANLAKEHSAPVAIGE